MNSTFSYPPRPARRGRVIALHCSGGSASHWSHLAEALGGRHDVAAPEHYGSQDAGAWGGEHAFTLDELWSGVDRLERRGVSLAAIGRALSQDWETSVIALARLGRRRP